MKDDHSNRGHGVDAAWRSGFVCMRWKGGKEAE